MSRNGIALSCSNSMVNFILLWHSAVLTCYIPKSSSQVNKIRFTAPGSFESSPSRAACRLLCKDRSKTKLNIRHSSDLLYLDLSIRVLSCSRGTVSPEAGPGRFRRENKRRTWKRQESSLAFPPPNGPLYFSCSFFRSFATNHTTGTLITAQWTQIYLERDEIPCKLC